MRTGHSDFSTLKVDQAAFASTEGPAPLETSWVRWQPSENFAKQASFGDDPVLWGIEGLVTIVQNSTNVASQPSLLYVARAPEDIFF